MSKNIAALFDLDGVIVDTEDEYTKFWDAQGAQYRPEIPHFAAGIKGNTLVQVFEKYFFGDTAAQEKITRELDEFERGMPYKYIDGILDFLKILKSEGAKTAIVTSSNNKKMDAVFARRPELRGFFDEVITSERVKKSKPDPEGYLLGASIFGADKTNGFVFEDSTAGLTAAKASGLNVIGLATTYPEERIAHFCDKVIRDYSGLDMGIFKEILRK
ncbi:MAG: HAD-IA family hydrolase [Opitutales bacterium]|nr:HAD-IA family hydrolase [Opitutales bacterium]